MKLCCFQENECNWRPFYVAKWCFLEMRLEALGRDECIWAWELLCSEGDMCHMVFSKMEVLLLCVWYQEFFLQCDTNTFPLIGEFTFYSQDANILLYLPTQQQLKVTLSHPGWITESNISNWCFLYLCLIATLTVWVGKHFRKKSESAHVERQCEGARWIGDEELWSLLISRSWSRCLRSSYEESVCMDRCAYICYIHISILF